MPSDGVSAAAGTDGTGADGTLTTRGTILQNRFLRFWSTF